MDSNRRLSREEFDEVIRRAAEMAARETDSADLTEVELYRIAQEVGLSESHVRRALVETRAAGPPARPANVIDRVFGPRNVAAARVVPGTPSELSANIDDFLVAGQLLQQVRRSDQLLQYRPAVDWASQVARAASATSRRYYVASAKDVEVRLEPEEDGRTVVEFVVDPGTRADHIVGALTVSTILGGGAGVGVGALILTAAPLALAVAGGIVVTAGMAASITLGVGRAHRKKTREVRAEVEGILDRLERGGGLEPPPPSWRRWVKRYFHGARRLLGDDDDRLGRMDGG